jgi:hypothetical protein
MADAQTHSQDTIFRKDGTILTGTMVEHIQGKYIRILTGDKVIMVPYDEIEKYYSHQSATSLRRTANKYNVRDRGISFSALAVTGIEVGKNRAAHNEEYYDGYLPVYVGADIIAGYQFNRHFFSAIGFGLQNYMTGTVLYPWYLNLKWNLSLNRVTPFIDASAGITITENEISGVKNYWYDGGSMINTSVGIKYFVRPKTGLIFSFGYCFEEYEYATHHYNTNIDQVQWFSNDLRSIVIKFGVNY